MLFTQTSPALIEAKLTTGQTTLLFSLLTGNYITRENNLDISSATRDEISTNTTLSRKSINTLLSQLINSLKIRTERLAVVVDIRQLDLASTELDFLQEITKEKIYRPQVIFLDSDDQTLARRYAQSRRPHPLDSDSISHGLILERKLLSPLRELADPVIDTSRLAPYELRKLFRKLFSPPSERSPLQITVSSFGFKNGLPLDIDMLYDVRFLPNPYWDERLRSFNGRNTEIIEYLEGFPETSLFLTQLKPFLLFLLSQYRISDRYYFKLSFGCTGGQHRSVYMAEQIYKYLQNKGIDARIEHRDVKK